MREPTTQQRQYKVLAVEDEAANLHLIAATLQGHYAVSVAKTLEKARELLSSNQFDILLLDINLPDGNGMTLCREVVENINIYGDIRVIFMTGLTSADDEVEGLNQGAADYIHKPLHSAVLLARVRLQAQLLRRNELLANLARIDGLTEIPNRRAFDSQLIKEWNRAKRERSNLILAMIDIDYFKPYNDHYGHPAGDKCLHDFAQFLNQFFKRSSDYVARYGGEEFVVLMSGIELENALELFNQAQKALEAKAIIHEHANAHGLLSFSAGLCSVHPQGDQPANLLECADKQLYAAKTAGRARTFGHEIKSTT